MAKYLEKSALIELDEYRQKIFALRKEAYDKFKIDLLDNDTLSSLSIYGIVSQYDAGYNINFARNGEDALSNGVKIEQKCSRVEKKKRSGVHSDAMFQFHAMGDLEYPRYILVARKKDDLGLLKIYDISEKKNVKMVQDYLLEERRKWLEKGRLDESKMKRDVIGIPEKVLIEKLKVKETRTVNGCQVTIA